MSAVYPFTAGTEAWARIGWIPLVYPDPEPRGDLHREPVAGFRALDTRMVLGVGQIPVGVSVDLVLRGPNMAPRVIPVPTETLRRPFRLMLTAWPLAAEQETPGGTDGSRRSR